MSKRRQAGDIIYKQPWAGFVGQGNLGVIQDENPDDHIPCMLGCGDENCVEWANVHLLPGNNLEEAKEALERKEFLGAAYHVSECQMADFA